MHFLPSYETSGVFVHCDDSAIPSSGDQNMRFLDVIGRSLETFPTTRGHDVDDKRQVKGLSHTTTTATGSDPDSRHIVQVRPTM